ncbi:MAG: 5-deoxy-glucuronate isomerase [Acidobacteria bacterium]|nr:5-deoxy-glucuronate isomerase [Acidobacteriota bacterium]MBI3427614.1 5-deoxy-glucuronate isomerase [Acidobacteriota bacterium]
MSDLLVRPATLNGLSGETLNVTPAQTGFEYLNFRARTLAQGETYPGYTDGNELGLVVLGGTCSVESPAGSWPHLGSRANVFSGMPAALYLPIHTEFTITAERACDLAFCYCRAEESFPARLIRPEDVEVEVRGGANATRQINHIIKPEFPAQRLLVVEVYTPSGNWSSYPPHKHDVHNPPAEVDLEEVYYYRIDKPEGYAIQKVYTPDRRIDATLSVRDGELVLIPEGYHPVVAAHGYNVYYLNALAGSARSMAASDDPDYAWVRAEWRETDPRVPLVK